MGQLQASKACSGIGSSAPKAALPETALSGISGFQRSAYSRTAKYLRNKGVRQMLIVDGQIHLWEKGTPSLQHRQEPYSTERAIAAPNILRSRQRITPSLEALFAIPANAAML